MAARALVKISSIEFQRAGAATLAALRTSMAFGSSEGAAQAQTGRPRPLDFLLRCRWFCLRARRARTTPSAITRSTARYLMHIFLASLTEVRVGASRNHSAFEHFVSYGRSYPC